MELAYEFTMNVELERPRPIGSLAEGRRVVVPIVGGTVTGDRINGSVIGPGADWPLIRNDGFTSLDVRIQIDCGDKAMIYMAYTGLLELNEAAQQALAGGETSFDDQYFRTIPRLMSGHPDYSWVNTTLFAARGRLLPGGVEYEVYRIP